MTKEDLDALLRHDNLWAERSTLILGIGIFGEYVLPLFFDESKKSLKKVALKVACGSLVVIGLAGEYWYPARISRTALQLQLLSDQKVADAEDRATKAFNAARDAMLNAGTAIKQAGQADDRASKAIERASKADERAGAAKERASANEKEAAALRKRAEDEAMARVKIEQSIAWRNPSRQLIPQMAQRLRSFSGQRYAFITDFSDPERIDLMSWLGILLGDSQWKIEAARSTWELGIAQTNIVVWIAPGAPDKVLRAAQSLVDVLTPIGLQPTLFQVSLGPPPEATPGEVIRIVIFKKGPAQKFIAR
jgi:hypothetical protein